MKAFFFWCLMAVAVSPVWAADCESIVVSGNPDYPPLTWREGEEIVGAGVELFKLAAKSAGAQVKSEFVGPWARVQHQARRGRVDVIVGLYKTEERKEYLNFIEPAYLQDPVVLFVRKGKAFPFAGLADLAKLWGATPEGNSQGAEFDAFARNSALMKYPKTVDEGFQLVLYDRVDYLAHGLYPGLAVAESLGAREHVEALPRYLGAEGMYVAFSKASACLKYFDAIRDAYARLCAEGAADRSMEESLKTWGATHRKPLTE